LQYVCETLSVCVRGLEYGSVLDLLAKPFQLLDAHVVVAGSERRQQVVVSLRNKSALARRERAML